MRVNSAATARPYEAPNHRNVKSVRLQGFEAGGPENFWVGLSHIAPGGGAGPDASPLEKVYVVLSGEILVRADGEERVLRAMESCCIGPNVEREMLNRSDREAVMIVVMPYPKA